MSYVDSGKLRSELAAIRDYRLYQNWITRKRIQGVFLVKKHKYGEKSQTDIQPVD